MNRQDERFSYADVFENETICSRESELLEYFENVMPEKSKPDFEKHLASCAICAEHLTSLQETSASGEMTMIDAAKADQIFQNTRAKLQNHLETKYGKPKQPNVPTHLFGGFRIPNYAGAIMAGLLLLLIYPAYKGFVLDTEVSRLHRELDAERQNQNQPQDLTQLQREYEAKIASLSKERDLLKQPSASLSEIHSVRSERSESNGRMELNYYSADQVRSVTLSVQGGYDEYLIELVQDDKIIWSDEVKAQSSGSEFALISVNFPGAFFTDAQYKLRISADAASGKQKLGEFRLKVNMR